MVLYTAKCYWPGVTESQLEQAVRGVNDHVGSLLFPDDDLVLVLFEGHSAGEIWSATEQAGIPCERVMTSRWLTPSRDEHGRPPASCS
jgi:hypothetical protein